MKLIKVTPDKEKVRSILKMISLLEERIASQDKERMSSLIISDYYEIIKELLTAVLLIDGYKTLSHKDLVDYVDKNYREILNYEISTLHKLRVLRNRITYEGFLTDPLYLKRNEKIFLELIKKLKKIVKERL